MTPAHHHSSFVPLGSGWDAFYEGVPLRACPRGRLVARRMAMGMVHVEGAVQDPASSGGLQRVAS